MRRRGLLITLEGIDGTGKSTQQRLLVRHLRNRGLTVVSTREPGGTRVGEQVRSILLASRTGHLAPLAELALIYAARAQHLEEVVRPALARKEIVVSDRFNHASLAYQGYGRKLGVQTVRAFDRLVCGRTQADLTVVLDLDPRVALARAQGREIRRNSARGRFEAAGLEFHQRVRAGYLAIARQDPRRVKVVKADRAVAEVQTEIQEIVDAFLARRQRARGSRVSGSGIR
ncbi:MAG: dTMP kinase [Acidobacteriia bacterium]|nr:dTMP kinase [Terriglobia bacterium]